ncbi:MAG: hypothetical protein NT026_02555 [Candidatus Staskawiczbacteria bacterium]|nr:hypothetical protein [Candidatus Staskawiczbacteria bacterium]
MPTTTVTTARTAKEKRAELKRLGFFHVTGLTWIDALQDEEGEIQAPSHQLCHWGNNAKWTVAVLENGEVWLMYGEPDDEIWAILRKLCPRGRGAFVPCDDDRTIYPEHAAARFRDPYYSGHADPTPRPR